MRLFRRGVVPAVALAVLAGALSVAGLPAARGAPRGMRAGVGIRDITWAVGASSGQVGTGTRSVSPDARFDLFQSAKLREPSQGFQSRTWARAIVVEGSNGQRIAYAQVDSYLMQDTLQRKVAELVARHDADHPERATGITRDRMILGSTHNHSAPQVTSAAWGVWAFTDAYDLRNFHHVARQTADAIIEAAGSMVPVRFGAAVGTIDDVQRNIVGPATADDGTPAGYPRTYGDLSVTVLRFDDVSNPADPVPLAVVGNFGMHPESLPGGHALLSADFNAMLHPAAESKLAERYRDEGPRACAVTVRGRRCRTPMLIWSQGSVGDTEPDQNQAGRGDFWRRGFGPTEVMARRMASGVVDAVAKLDAPNLMDRSLVPFTTDAPVGVVDMYLPGPLDAAHPEDSRPVPMANNCRTAEVAADKGQPRVGTVASCDNGPAAGPTPAAGVADTFERITGLPFPRNQGASPSRGALNETYQIHLTVARIGQVLIGTCPCEAQSDQILNFKSRADDVSGNIYDGYEWPCGPGEPGRVVCSYPDPSAPASYVADAARWDLARKQVHNDARERGQAGNFTKVEFGAGEVDAALYAGTGLATGLLSFQGLRGFTIPLMITQAQDYVGYIASYREFMSRDHYRKTLTSFGPHSSDYINTFLLRGARVLRTGTPDPILGLYAKPLPDPQREAEYQAYAGRQGEIAVEAYTRGIPDDSPGAGRATIQPEARTRFGVPRFTWQGGNNAVDLPKVTVVDADGRVVATNDHGEVVTTVDFPKNADAPGWVSAGRPYLWTAHWEAGVDAPTGELRFLVRGVRRQGGEDRVYELTSDPFTVDAWRSGAEIATEVSPLAVPVYEVRVGVGQVPYPQAYDARDQADPRTPRYIDPASPYKKTFRPRPGTWQAASVLVRTDAGAFPAVWTGSAFVANVTAADPSSIEVRGADVLDAYGNPAG